MRLECMLGAGEGVDTAAQVPTARECAAERLGMSVAGGLACPAGRYKWLSPGYCEV